MEHTRGSTCFPLTHNALHFTVNAALELIEWALKKETQPSTFPSALSKHPETGVQHTQGQFNSSANRGWKGKQTERILLLIILLKDLILLNGPNTFIP